MLGKLVINVGVNYMWSKPKDIRASEVIPSDSNVIFE